MAEVEGILNRNRAVWGHLNRESPKAFADSLFQDPTMRGLVRTSEEYSIENALNGEWPSDMILRLLPSDGHLE